MWPLIALLAATPVAHDPCAPLPDGVVLHTARRVLVLCHDGVAEAAFAVNLGQRGVGKRRQGDKKTPLGRYPLSPPRPSYSGFTWFVPVGYPTARQRAAGYTGGAIGIHGPPDWMPQAVIDVAFDRPWTDGCIMVRTRREIDAIRRWLLEHRPDTIEIVRGAAAQ